ncbi:MAG TPA: porin family protein [Bacteroidia bacterium]|nr:porin family protein [Bacteroidia bacterium]
MKHIRYILCSILTFLSIGYIQAQSNSNDNLPKYYNEKLHFGFTLGVNKADFIIHPVKGLNTMDSLKYITSQPNYGFNLGIVSEFAFTEYLCIRFVPDLSFAARTLTYTFDTPIDTSRGYVPMKKLVESTFVEFPLDLKLRSQRMHDFAAYVLAGAKYSIDLASQKNVNNTNAQDAVVKLRKDDYGLDVGTGVEFFMPYFKLGFELKFTYGFKDLIVHDQYIYSTSIEKLNTKMFLFSVTFEG